MEIQGENSKEIKPVSPTSKSGNFSDLLKNLEIQQAETQLKALESQVRSEQVSLKEAIKNLVKAMENGFKEEPKVEKKPEAKLSLFA